MPQAAFAGFQPTANPLRDPTIPSILDGIENIDLNDLECRWRRRKEDSATYELVNLSGYVFTFVSKSSTGWFVPTGNYARTLKKAKEDAFAAVVESARERIDALLLVSQLHAPLSTSDRPEEEQRVGLSAPAYYVLDHLINTRMKHTMDKLTSMHPELTLRGPKSRYGNALVAFDFGDKMGTVFTARICKNRDFNVSLHTFEANVSCDQRCKDDRHLFEHDPAYPRFKAFTFESLALADIDAAVEAAFNDLVGHMKL